MGKSRIVIILFLVLIKTNLAYTQVIMGSVKNINQEPIIGVNIYSKNGLGTITNNQGYFIFERKNLDSLSLEFSHISYKPLTSKIASKKDTVFLDVIMDSEIKYLKEVFVTLKVDDGRKIILEALKNLFNNVKLTPFVYYNLTHFVENNEGKTNYFNGLVELYDVEYKVRKNDGKLLFSLSENANPKVLKITERKVAPDTKGCNEFCSIINNKQGMEVFVPIAFNWLRLPLAIVSRINDTNYSFNIIDEQQGKYDIEITSHKKKKEHDIRVIIDKETLNFVSINFSVSRTLNKYWNKNITSVVKKGKIIPVPVFLRQKERIWNYDIYFDSNDNDVFFKEIILTHSLQYNKKYIDNKYLKKTHFARWILKKDTINIKSKNSFLIKSYKDLYHAIQ